MKAAIYFTDTDCLSDDSLYEKALRAVSKTRRERTSLLRYAPQKRQSLGAGLLLMRAMSDAGLDPFRSETAEGENGKPFLTAYSGVFFNLSHSGSAAMCVMADVEAGCDIERIKTARAEIAERFFDEEEVRDILRTEEPERAIRFYRTWTRKESYIKCLGTGMATPLNSFRIRETEKGITVMKHGERLPFSFLQPDSPEGYVSACCFRCSEPPEKARTERVDLVDFIANITAG